MKILILGAGKMVDALLQGLVPDQNEYFIYSPSGTSAEALASKFNLTKVDQNLIPSPDIVLLGHKPQQLKKVASDLNGRFVDVPVISMLAAVDEKTQLEVLKVKELIRIMPNLNVGQKRGITLLSSDSSSKDRKEWVKSWLHPTGLCLEVEEIQFNELTLLTGCGPAIFYQFAASLAACFSTITKDESIKLACHVFQGSADLLRSYSGDFEKAIQDVASKGGVTEAILQEMTRNQFIQELQKAILSGKRRTQEIKDSILRS